MNADYCFIIYTFSDNFPGNYSQIGTMNNNYKMSIIIF